MSILSKAARRVLTELRDDPEADLVEEGREVWCGSRRTTKAVLNELLRFCLVKPENGSSFTNKLVRYEISEHGRWALRDESAALVAVARVALQAEAAGTTERRTCPRCGRPEQFTTGPDYCPCEDDPGED